jgi:hypothetical protein
VVRVVPAARRRQAACGIPRAKRPAQLPLPHHEPRFCGNVPAIHAHYGRICAPGQEITAANEKAQNDMFCFVGI